MMFFDRIVKNINYSTQLIFKKRSNENEVVIIFQDSFQSEVLLVLNIFKLPFLFIIFIINNLFGFYVQQPGDILSAIEQRKDNSYKRKLRIQPYLLVEGDSIDNLRCFYVVIDSVKYQFDSCSRAFDTLFKSFHIFHAEYPVESQHIYMLIQRGVYNIITKYDNVTPHMFRYLNLFAS